MDFLKAQIKVKSACCPWCLAKKETSEGSYIGKEAPFSDMLQNQDHKWAGGPKEIQNWQHLSKDPDPYLH